MNIYDGSSPNWKQVTTLYLNEKEVADFKAGKVKESPSEWNDVLVGDSLQVVR